MVKWPREWRDMLIKSRSSSGGQWEILYHLQWVRTSQPDKMRLGNMMTWNCLVLMVPGGRLSMDKVGPWSVSCHLYCDAVKKEIIRRDHCPTFHPQTIYRLPVVIDSVFIFTIKLVISNIFWKVYDDANTYISIPMGLQIPEHLELFHGICNRIDWFYHKLRGENSISEMKWSK